MCYKGDGGHRGDRVRDMEQASETAGPGARLGVFRSQPFYCSAPRSPHLLYKEDLRMCLADREVSNLSAEGRKHMTVTFDQPSGRRQERDPFPLSQASVVIGHLLRIQELCHPL